MNQVAEHIVNTTESSVLNDFVNNKKHTNNTVYNTIFILVFYP